MKKFLCKTLALGLACFMVFSSVGCGNSDSGKTPSDGENGQVKEYDENVKNSVVKFAFAEDKIYQTYDRAVDGQVDTELYAQGQEFYAKLTDSFSVTAFRNETESRQMIITASADVSDYNLEVSDFTKGNDVLSSAAFALGHEYYHNVTSVLDPKTPMSSGMIPDAIIPLRYARSNGLNKIKANENQGIFITVTVPKEQAAGEYTGTLKLTLDGYEKIIIGKVTVLDYTLPDETVARSCMIVDGTTENGSQYLQLDSSQESYWKFVEKLGEFRLSAQYMYGMKINADTLDDVEVLADEHVKYMLLASANPKINTYSIRTNGKWATVEGFTDQKVTLNEDYFMVYTKKMVDATLKEGVDLFRKATVYMGSIIDEPEDTVGNGIVDYVCEQFHDCLRRTVAYLNSVKDTAEKADNVDAAFIESVIANIYNVTNVVTTSSEPYIFNEVDSYCPKVATPWGKHPEPVGSSAKLEAYADLKDQTTSNGRTKDFWWYTHQTPYYPNPTLHIDDNGVSARVMFWMMSEYDIKGYLIWETTLTDGNRGWELYENVSRDRGSSVGDAFMFYPGYLLGMDGPVPAVRLYYMRDGIEDYDAMYDLKNNLYGGLSAKYGADLSVDGVLNEMYASVYTLNKTYATSAELASARKNLESLLVWANHGIAISDFKISANGAVTAKVYAPATAIVSANGNVLENGTPQGEGVVYNINKTAKEIVFKADGLELSIDTSVKSVFTANADKITVYTMNDNSETVVQDASVAADSNGITVNVKKEYTEIDYTVAGNDITSEDKSLIIVIDYDGTEKTTLEIGVKGVLVKGSFDTVYLHPGENVIRVDRLQDVNWNALDTVKRITLVPEENRTADYTITIKSISVIE